MKQLTCEMCGSNNLLKQEGVFVCQSCGTKYSVEEAKKMMVEGTVKIDNSEELKALYEVARRAKQSGNSAQAAKYYEMILCKDAFSWEASFYSMYYTVLAGRKGNCAALTTQMAGTVATTFPLIQKAHPNESDLYKILYELADDLCKLSETVYLALISLEVIKYRNAPVFANPFNTQSIPACKTIAECANKELSSQIKKHYADNAKFVELADALLSRYALGNHYSTNCTDYLMHEMQGVSVEGHGGRASIAKGIEHVQGKISTNTQPAAQSGGCYVATAVYGSYDCPEVWTLRRFRDDTLAETWYGRAFIHTYYAISPTLVKWFGNTVWFKKLWKGKLDRMVKDLQSKGVAATPYEDRDWNR